jgi:hypothetical protein
VVAIFALYPSLSAAKPPELCPEALTKGIRAAGEEWLFVENELVTSPVPTPATEAGFSSLLRALASINSEVVVLLLPSRGLSTLASDAIAEFDRKMATASHTALAQRFEQQGLPVVDTFRESQSTLDPDAFYLYRNNHLSHAGVRALATHVATTIAALPVAKLLPKVPFESTLIGRVPVVNEPVSVLVNRFCGTPLPTPQASTRWRTKRLDQTGLLDNEAPPSVTIWGSSQASEVSNMEGFVQEALQTPVLSMATTGGGVLSSLYSAVRDPAWPNNATPLILWEFTVAEYWRTNKGAPNPQDPEIYDEIVPAVYGQCSDDAALARSEAVASGHEAKLGGPLPASGGYLVLDADRPDLAGLVVGVTDGAGTRVEHTFEDYARAPAHGRYFLALPALVGTLKVQARFDSPSASLVQTRLCAWPKPE